MKEVEKDVAINNMMMNLNYSFTIPKLQSPGASQGSLQDETFLLHSHSFGKVTRTSEIFSLGQGCWKPTKTLFSSQKNM